VTATTEQLLERFLALPPYQQRRLAIKHADAIRTDDFLLYKQLRALHHERETPTGLAQRRSNFIWLQRCQEWTLNAEERHLKLVVKQLGLLKCKLRRLHAREAAQQRALNAVRRRLERLLRRQQVEQITRIKAQLRQQACADRAVADELRELAIKVAKLTGSAAPARQRRPAPAPVAPPPPPRPLTVAERMAAAWDRISEDIAA